MPTQHLVRVGLFGQVGRFSSPTGESVARGRRVVCRTARGLEVGIVMCGPESAMPEANEDGVLLRRLTVEDELLVARLERSRAEAFEACVDALQARQIAATLVDVEHLFDGRSLYFYFLGEVTPQIDALTRELAEVYESRVQFRQFTDALERGCGPACGTADATGCGTGCSSCAIAAACGR